jgi:hypothetical protein
MLVTVGICKLSDGRFRLTAQRPQHHAEAAKDYSSEQAARSALVRLGFAEDTINALVSLLREVEQNVNLNFTATDIPYHLLRKEGLSIEIQSGTP